MSFVFATPDLVESAASDLAGIRSSLAEATATAAVPTTGIASAAEDEVSIALASTFGDFGEQFQALSAQAQSFHAQFVELMNAGAGAYATAEAANAGQGLLGGDVLGGISQTIGGSLSGGEAALGRFAGSFGANLGGALTGLQADANAASATTLGVPAALSGTIQTGAQGISQAATGFQTQFGALATGGMPGLIADAKTFANQVAGPYEALVANTANNLQSLGNTVAANPFPVLHQLVDNQIGYGQAIGTAIGTGVANLPAELAHLPATLDAALQSVQAFNPAPYLQQFADSQISYAQTIVAGLANAGPDLITELQQLPGGFQAAFQDLLVGDNAGAYGAVNQALINAFLPGFNVPPLDATSTSPVPVTPIGVLGDLLPPLNLPAQLAQNLANLVPANTIAGTMAHNAANVFEMLGSFETTLNPQTLGINFSVPLELVFDAIGAPANALSALNSTSVAFVNAVQTGNASGAVGALLDAPAFVANGFLNGQTVISLPPTTLDLLGFPITTPLDITLGGLIAPLSPLTVYAFGLPLQLLDGSHIGGLIPGLLNVPLELVAAITPTA